MSERSLLRSEARSSLYEAIPTSNMPLFQSNRAQLPHKMQIYSSRGGVVTAWFHNLFTVIIGLSTLGSSVTFSYIVSGIRGPKARPRFSMKAYESFMAISWLLFIIDLAISTLFSTILSFYREQAILKWGDPDRSKRLTIQWIATLCVALLYTLTISAFIFLALVITAYAAEVGWLALGFAVSCGVGGLVSIVWQSPAFQTRPAYEQSTAAAV